jgi:hypothetical protein
MRDTNNAETSTASAPAGSGNQIGLDQATAASTPTQSNGRSTQQIGPRHVDQFGAAPANDGLHGPETEALHLLQIDARRHG